MAGIDKTRGSFGSTATKPAANGFGGGFGSAAPAPTADDWDDSPSAPVSNGFGSSSGSGFGSGGFGSSSGGGFGSSSGGGFGSSSGGGFGSSSGGRFGSSSGGGFGSGGGSSFGGGNSGSGCRKCGEEGHFARECPQGGGNGGGGRGCHKCGEEGHFARECPQGGGSGGGSRACHKCGEEGHFARECPQAGGGSSGGFGGGGFGSSGGGFGGGFGGASSGGGGDSAGVGGSGCRNCGEDGHFARECPNPRKPQGACHSCGEGGHFSKDCPTKADRLPTENYIPPDDTTDESIIFKSYAAGINFDKYDKIPVEISGNNPTKPVQSFSDAGLLPTVEANVRKANYKKPTPVQKYSIPAIIAGRDLMGCAQTGSGKTAAFLLPVLTGMMQKGIESGSYSAIQEPQAIVVAPTRELAIQIYNECRKFSLGTIVRCVKLYGGTSTMHQSSDLAKGANIIVATPGRLMDFIERRKIGLEKLQYLILDEADRMLDMGFEPVIRRLVEQCGMPSKKDRQTLMFSATFPPEIQELARDFLNDYLFLTVGMVGGANQDVTQSIVEVTQFEKRDKLMELLREHPGQRTLVFVEQKRNADFLASMLSQSEFATTSIHGDRLQREREQALADFKAGISLVLVATSVAARGLDIPSVDHVVNYDMPQSIDDYVHRIGRTGRCGNLGRATSFFDREANGDLARALVKILSESHQEVPDFLEQAAQGGYGGSGGGYNRGGHRDVRAGGGDMGGWDETPGGTPAIAADEDSWD